MKPAQTGFSLAELLLVLLILGQIAAFTIPKVLTSQQNSQKTAVFKETYATLFEVFYTSIQTGTLVGDDFTLFKSKINHVKACNPCSAGCSAAAQNRSNEPGIVLHNGAVICGFNQTWVPGAGAPGENVSVDWNGPTGPNVDGQDTIVFEMYYDSSNPNARIEFKPLNGTDQLIYAIFK